MAYVLIVKGYCHGSGTDRGNKYTASDGLGMFAQSPETDPSRNTLERGGNKGDRLKVAISSLERSAPIYREPRESDLIWQYTYPSIPYGNSRESFRFFCSISYLGLRTANIYIYIHIYIQQFYRTYLKYISKRTIDSTSRLRSRSTGFVSFVLSIHRRHRQNKPIHSRLTGRLFYLLGSPRSVIL